MNLKERLNADFITAFKNKEMEKKNFLGLLKGEIQNEETRRTNSNDDDVVMIILKKMEKSLKQTNSTESLGELEYLAPYLPVMKTEEELTEIILGYKSEGVSNVGQLMSRLNREYKWAIDNNLVSKIAPNLLK